MNVPPADRRAHTWVPAFERDRAKALQDARHAYGLTPLHEVVRIRQLPVAAAPAVDALHGLGPRRAHPRGAGRGPGGRG